MTPLPEYRPEFGSLVAAILSVAAAAVCLVFGRYLGGIGGLICIICALLLVFSGTVGLLFGLDLWSLYRGVR